MHEYFPVKSPSLKWPLHTGSLSMPWQLWNAGFKNLVETIKKTLFWNLLYHAYTFGITKWHPMSHKLLFLPLNQEPDMQSLQNTTYADEIGFQHRCTVAKLHIFWRRVPGIWHDHHKKLLHCQTHQIHSNHKICWHNHYNWHILQLTCVLLKNDSTE